jgi:hypothetical protein
MAAKASHIFSCFVRQYGRSQMVGDHRIASFSPWREDRDTPVEVVLMRRQQLMEPDFLSELLLLVMGTVLFFFPDIDRRLCISEKVTQRPRDAKDPSTINTRFDFDVITCMM